MNASLTGFLWKHKEYKAEEYFPDAKSLFNDARNVKLSKNVNIYSHFRREEGGLV